MLVHHTCGVKSYLHDCFRTEKTPHWGVFSVLVTFICPLPFIAVKGHAYFHLRQVALGAAPHVQSISPCDILN